MDLSIFENDGTLGNAGTRPVVISLSGSFYFTSNWGTNGRDNMAAVLAARGWDIDRIQGLSNTWYPGSPLSFLIFANVENQYSDAAIVNNVRNDLLQIMSVSDVRIVRASPAEYTSLQNAAAAQANAGSDFLGNLGTSLGISTPIALVAGGLLLIFLLRR